MSSKTPRSVLLAMCTATALWLATAMPAHAILYKGIIDPEFHAGGTVATGDPLGWSAEIIFDIDGCELSFGLTTCSTMDLMSATGTLYDINDTDHTPVSNPTILDYLPGGPSSTLINSVLFDDGGGVVGLNTAPIGPAFATASSTYLTNGAANLWLQFFANDFIFLSADALTTVPDTGGYLIVATCSSSFGEGGTFYLCPQDPSAGVYSDTAQVTFTQISAVPEPASLLLIIMAGAAAWVAGRRRLERNLETRPVSSATFGS